jgi:hypothetical protein
MGDSRWFIFIFNIWASFTDRFLEESEKKMRLGVKRCGRSSSESFELVRSISIVLDADYWITFVFVRNLRLGSSHFRAAIRQAEVESSVRLTSLR